LHWFGICASLMAKGYPLKLMDVTMAPKGVEGPFLTLTGNKENVCVSRFRIYTLHSQTFRTTHAVGRLK
jgi:hypothetical protein